MSNNTVDENPFIYYLFDLFITTITCLFIFIMIILLFMMYVFGILFLIKDKNASDNCKSNIWMYVVTALFVSLYGNIMFIRKYEYISKLSYIYLFLGIWGIIVSISESCGEIMETYLFAYTWGISIFFLVISIILFIINCTSRYI